MRKPLGSFAKDTIVSSTYCGWTSFCTTLTPPLKPQPSLVFPGGNNNNQFFLRIAAISGCRSHPPSDTPFGLCCALAYPSFPSPPPPPPPQPPATERSEGAALAGAGPGDADGGRGGLPSRRAVGQSLGGKSGESLQEYSLFYFPLLVLKIIYDPNGYGSKCQHGRRDGLGMDRLHQSCLWCILLRDVRT